MWIEKGKWLFTAGLRNRSISIGFQITFFSLDLDLVFFWIGIERRTW